MKSHSLFKTLVIVVGTLDTVWQIEHDKIYSAAVTIVVVGILIAMLLIDYAIRMSTAERNREGDRGL